MTQYSFDAGTVSDLHKDVYGFRPGEDFWANWALASDDEKQSIWDSLIKGLEATMAAEEALEQAAIAEFEDRVEQLLKYGAQNRAEAIDWIVQSLELTETELMYGGEYACFQLGLPYRFQNELNPAVDKLLKDVA